MRITVVLPVYWPAIGGCEIHTRALVAGLRRRGHEVRVVTMLNRQEEKLRHPDLWRTCLLHARRGGAREDVDGVPVHLVGFSAGERALLYPVIRAYRRAETPAMGILERALARHLAPHVERAELVHVVHGGVSFLGRAAHRAARARRLPFVFTAVLHIFHGWDDLLAGGPGPTAGGAEAGKGTGEPRGDDYGVPYLKRMPATYHDRFWDALIREADGVIALTEEERRVLVREGARPERVHVTGVGPVVESGGPTREEMRARHGLGEDPVVLFLGRKHELKGVPEILQAAPAVWQRVPEARFVFVGPREGSTEALFARHRDPRVLEVGPVTGEEKSGWLRACDLFVNPSVHESLGGVFLEAWSFGKPVVAGDIPPVREISEGGKGGILVARRNPEEIARAIVRLLADRERAERAGAWGAERVRRRYTWEEIARRTEAAYDAARRTAGGAS